MLYERGPVEPPRFVIPALLVVTTLCSPHFVTHEKHGHTDRKQDAAKVLHTSIPEFLTPGSSVDLQHRSSNFGYIALSRLFRHLLRCACDYTRRGR